VGSRSRCPEGKSCPWCYPRVSPEERRERLNEREWADGWCSICGVSGTAECATCAAMFEPGDPGDEDPNAE
jgi:hypothetical protein